MTDRRTALKTLGIAGAGWMIHPQLKAETPKAADTFRFCLNTSTISGQNLGMEKNIEVAARAGYEGIELWIRDILAYLENGKSTNQLKKHLSDAGLTFENAIGFAPWMVDEDEKRKAGFVQMKEEMELLAALGCKRVAAPAAGVTGTLDLFEAGGRYRDLLQLGRETGVMPQLEFWGAFPYFHHLGQALMVAAVSDDADARILADVYHLYRGNSGFEGLKMLQGKSVEIFHMNDYVMDIPREKQEDKDRVYPGDGAAPLQQILTDLKNMGGEKVLSLELFNRDYWKLDALEVAKTGLDKMRGAVALVTPST
ncbi:sugar phosphate isomerase/epimerase family protein [Pararhodonellum marinum]|uniref:sugar phosphate isomerase/epimerase family protein n=1 Tax=Pararhodonellum marinum TaxID=2755358 RepID=UPI00188FAD9F|nr:sugar phosphate isomerase/epimerase [Pararhodonellum marinum]